MKVTCQSCQAKYTIADEKVRGKVAKIRCKKCGTTIIVDGADGQPTVASSEAPIAEVTGQGVDERWSIIVAEGDEREVTVAQLAVLYAGGTINEATVVWKQGMPDWQSIGEVPELRSLVESSRPSRLPVSKSIPVGVGEVDVPLSIAPRTRPGEGVAARRVGRAGTADLFGGSTDDVTTSASAGTGTRPIEDKPTGARNENSVLFSLSALTGGTAPSAASGFAQPAESNNPSSARADLSALVRGADKPAAPVKNKLDDIMNLGGGGLYSPALMAPSLTAPSVEYSATGEAPSAASKGKSKGMLMMGVGAVVILGGAVAAFSAMSSAPAPSLAPSAAAIASGSRAAEPTIPAQDPEKPAVAAAASAQAAPTAEVTAAATTMTPGQAAQPASKPEVEKRVVATPKPVERVEKAEKVEKPDRPAVAAPAPAAPAAASTADFDRAAALSALSTAATASQACKKPDGPTGAGRISVTFANNGSATTAAVEGPPFAGTSVGGCVAARFRSARVPAFGGSPVTVHKSFNIN